jgi:hypothetical protein
LSSTLPRFTPRKVPPPPPAHSPFQVLFLSAHKEVPCHMPFQIVFHCSHTVVPASPPYGCLPSFPHSCPLTPLSPPPLPTGCSIFSYSCPLPPSPLQVVFHPLHTVQLFPAPLDRLSSIFPQYLSLSTPPPLPTRCLSSFTKSCPHPLQVVFLLPTQLSPAPPPLQGCLSPFPHCCPTSLPTSGNGRKVNCLMILSRG